MAYNIGGLTKRNVATPEDTTKVLEKIYQQYADLNVELKKDSIATQKHIDTMNPETLSVVKLIEKKKDRLGEINVEMDGIKVVIPPHKFSDVVPDYLMGQYNDELVEYIQGFSNEGGVYTLRQADDLINQLDNEILVLQREVLNKGNRAVEDNWANARHINNIIQIGAYPELFNFWGDTGQIDKNGEPIWRNSHGFLNDKLSWFDKGGAQEETPSSASVYPKPNLGSQPQSILQGVYANTMNMDHVPFYLSNKKLHSYTMSGDHPDRSMREMNRGTRDMLHHDLTYMFSNPEVVGYGESVTMYDAMENLEGIMLKDLTKMQWLLKQRHEIMCRTSGGGYCNHTTGSDSEGIPIREYIENLTNEKHNISNYINDMGQKYGSLISEEMVNLGFKSSGVNPGTEDYHGRLIDFAKAAWSDLVEESQKSDKIYLTKGMQEFYKDILNNPDQLDYLLKDFINENKSK